ncbi:hypothetical protein C8Q74DRAFT_1281153 [Fomes fomentarius]|nr:hypothetical protein C8Q74DRAFT_1281153 [Fomes fomentarius]
MRTSEEILALQTRNAGAMINKLDLHRDNQEDTILSYSQPILSSRSNLILTSSTTHEASLLYPFLSLFTVPAPSLTSPSCPSHAVSISWISLSQ